MSAETVAALLAAVILLAVAALHAVWTRSPWPLSSWDRLRTVVVGQESPARAPSAGATWAVVGLLVAAAVLVLAGAGLVGWPLPDWVLQVGLWTAAGVLLARGVGGLVGSGFFGWGTPEFRYWNLRLYSPLTLLLGSLLAVAAAA